ncbi:MAG: glycosyltransferase family 4 protein [Candidatus Dormibacteraeota bacterium]|nr:glycosyltransferase family 4 protein [Candidatus Dormibacteraeota bacterium]
MKLLFAVQRYGREVFGGSEAACREVATRLAARGHEVEVVTSCALSYYDWTNHFPAGESIIDGVKVHRLPVPRPRDHDMFDRLQVRLFQPQRWMAGYLQREWVREQGPWLPQLPQWFAEHAPGFDVTVFFTYLYYTSWAGLHSVSTPTVLAPTAHDEPPAYVPIMDELFRLPDAFAFLTPEEADFVRRRFRVRRPFAITGIGIESQPAGDAGAFRRRYGLEDRPYIACVGRTDPSKGSTELFEMFAAYKRRRPGPLALVFIGEEVHPLPRHPDVVMTGYVDEDTRHGGLKGSRLLVQPSYFESFSMVLTEAWACDVPAIVQGRSEVLVGQSRRSGGGLPYSGYAEFEAALDVLLEDDELRGRMAASGRSYVEIHYNWDRVLDRYEALLEQLA